MVHHQEHRMNLSPRRVTLLSFEKPEGKSTMDLREQREQFRYHVGETKNRYHTAERPCTAPWRGISRGSKPTRTISFNIASGSRSLAVLRWRVLSSFYPRTRKYYHQLTCFSEWRTDRATRCRVMLLRRRCNRNETRNEMLIDIPHLQHRRSAFHER